jgi:hypothetical protein
MTTIYAVDHHKAKPIPQDKESAIRKDERNKMLDDVVKILNDAMGVLEKLQIDGYASATIIAQRDVIEYLLEKIVKLRKDGE